MSFCKYCGAKLDANAVFCEGCGNRIERENPQGTPVNQPTTGANYRKNTAPVMPRPVAKKKKKNSLIIVLLIVASLALVASAGFLAYQYFSHRDSGGSAPTQAEPTATPTESSSDAPPTDSPDGQSTPAPTPTPEMSKPEKKNSLIDMNEVNSIIANAPNGTTISMCVYDLKNDVTYATDNANRAISSSALVNIPVLYTASQDMADGDVSWNSQILFQFIDTDGRGKLEKEDDGKYFSMNTLLQYMLAYSDNNATNSLMEHYGQRGIVNLCKKHSYNSVRVERYLGVASGDKDNYISAKDATGMLAQMYQSKGGAVDCAYLQKNFRIEDSNKTVGIGKYLPHDVTFLNHNAVTSTVYNEIAIVSSEDAEYIITVLSEGSKPEKQKDVIADLALYVHDALSK